MRFRLLVLQEFKAIISDESIALTVFVAVIGYAILYPIPYWHEVPIRQKMVVIDHDKSSLSRKFIRDAKASPKLDIIAQVESIDDAEQWVNKGWAHGLLIIPDCFKRDLLTGKGTTLSLSGDASYLLIYSAVIEGLLATEMNLSNQFKLNALLLKGINKTAAKLQLHPVNINRVPVFNPTLGYTPYVVPGLFLLILHQTMLIGLAILGASQWRQTGYWSSVPVIKLISARLFTFLLIYTCLTLIYVSYFYYFYRVNLLAHLFPLMFLILSFLSATAAMGLAFSSLFIRRDLPTQVVLLTSMPIVFSSGFVWPLLLIPKPIIWVSNLMPATPAIMAMLKLNQMGASWQSVFPLWLHLWLLFIFYIALAVWGFNRRLK